MFALWSVYTRKLWNDANHMFISEIEAAQEESVADDISEHKSEAEPSVADDQSSL